MTKALVMPTAIHLGPYTYRLTDSPDDWAKLDRDDRENCYGYTLHTTATIYIQPDMEPALKRVIVLHEILHAAAFAGGQMDNRKRDEEAWVVMTAAPLMDALKRSTGLTDWLMS